MGKLKRIHESILSNLEVFKKQALMAASVSELQRHYGLPQNGSSLKWLRKQLIKVGVDLSIYEVSKYRVNAIYDTIERQCPFCGKTFITKSGGKESKKHCSQSCRSRNRSYPTLKKTGEQKEKDYWEKYGPKNCRECGKSFQTGSPQRNYCSNECSNAHKSNPSPEHRAKLRDIQLKAIREGRHKGWKSRTKLEPSYAEKFFIGVLDSRKILYERERREVGYFIDFALILPNGGKIALEIDGRQHRFEDRQRSDRIKDITLEKAGWNVYRIKWKSINSKPGKDYIKSEIDRFIDFYNAMSF